MCSVGGEDHGVESRVGFIFGEGLYETCGFKVEQSSSEKNPTSKDSLQVAEEVEDVLEPLIVHKGFASGDLRQQYVQYAYSVGGIDLVTLIECENGSWNMYRQSEVVKNGRREKSFGFCQISQVYHPEIVNTDEFWNDWKWQLGKCNELMKSGTAFYGRDRKIKGVKCSTYVKDRFILECR